MRSPLGLSLVPDVDDVEVLSSHTDTYMPSEPMIVVIVAISSAYA
jgi:hypothetical protein